MHVPARYPRPLWSLTSALLILPLIHLIVVDSELSCPADELDRVDCYPEGSSSQPSADRCASRGCCWSLQGMEKGSPPCFFPIYYGYKASSVPRKDGTTWQAELDRIGTPSLYGKDVDTIQVLVQEQTRNRLRIKFYDPNEQRFEVPFVRIEKEENGFQDLEEGPSLFNVFFMLDPFSITVTRRKNNQTIFDTSMGGLVFSDQFLQLSAQLASSNVYGLGEHLHTQLKHDMNWRTWPIHAAGKHPIGPEAKNMYGAHPVILNIEENGDANMVLLLNQHAMDVVLQPKPAITYRTIGGILDFYIFLSGEDKEESDDFCSKESCSLGSDMWKPSPPIEVNQLYLQAIGLPPMPPYWALGFQLSRWDYNGSDKLKEVISRTREAGIPYDVQWADIDYMISAQTFTIDPDNYPDLPSIVEDLHQGGQKFIAIHDPMTVVKPRGKYAAYDDGCDAGVWITNASGEPLQGKFWGGICVFPDYTKDETFNWWLKHCSNFHQILPHDGFWIDMNEPSNFIYGSTEGCMNNTWNYPPFLPNVTGGLLWDRTLCMDSRQSIGKHYDLHSLYGHSMANATWHAAKAIFGDKRNLIVSRSTFVGSGQFAGKWLGDNSASYRDMKWSITGMIELNMFGFPLVGADICGFFDDSSEHLCQRWMQLGAFYTFSRNHNNQKPKDQDPAAPRYSQAMVESSRRVLLVRYSLLPYLYTLFYHAHTTGATVIRPIAFEFPADVQGRSVDRQFMWGPALLISPALEANQTIVTAYIPEGRWYNHFTGEEMDSSGWQNLETAFDEINLHVRGGFIIPMQLPEITTSKSRKNPMKLMVALNDLYEAEGMLFWDDGETVDTHLSPHLHRMIYFTAKRDKLVITTHKDMGMFDPEVVLDVITVFGLKQAPSFLMLYTDGEGMEIEKKNVVWLHPNMLTLENLHLDMTKSHLLTWRI